MRAPVSSSLAAGLRIRWSILLAALLPALCLCASAADPLRPASTRAKTDPVKVDAETEKIIKGSLKYLASKQTATGAWGAYGEEKQRQLAMTGYVLICYQASGHLPGEGEYGKNVTAGMQYLLDIVGPDGVMGNRSDGQYMYGHGIASIALAELYGQTKNPAMRAKLDRVIKLIISAQNTEGGWRYRPVSYDADISVTVLQVVALRAAKNGGIEVPQKTIDDAVKYVKACFDERTGGFCYQPYRDPGFARTAAAIYSLQVCGLYDDKMVGRGSKYLFDNYREDHEWFAYGNFYAAPAQYMIGGETWSKWYATVKDTLLKTVRTDGDLVWWEARGRGGVGPNWSTAVYATMLAMPYHYIPLYQR